jgi:hypothetical protein
LYPTVSALFAAFAAWLSMGTLALTTEEGPRIALLPVSAAAVAVSIAVGAAVFAAVRAARTAAPLLLLLLLFLPWLPFPVPSAFLIWSGPLRLAIWSAVLVLLAAQVLRYRLDVAVGVTGARRVSDLLGPAAAGCLSLLIAGASAVIAAPSVPGGDEPHYLIITQSLLRDGDLQIENNHLRGDYQTYFPGQLRPDYLRRGRDGEIYSIHAPGISAIVAPAFAVGGYRGVVVFLVMAAALGGALLWHVSWLASGSRKAAWFGWAAIVFSPTWIFHAFTVYPDGVGSALALTGAWALLRAGEESKTGATSSRPWLLHGLALALLPWLHTRFALIAGTFGALILLRLATTRNPAAKAVAFLSIPAVSALVWVGYFIAIYGTPDPAAPYGSSREFSAAFIPGGLAGLLFDQRFGLFANAPVLVCTLFGFGAMLGAQQRRLAIELLFVIVAYLLTVSSYAMWWGGWSAPARFAAAAVPLLGVPAAAAWARFGTKYARTLMLGGLSITAFISAALVAADRGRLAFNTRESYALWLDWASPLADLGRGMPVWFRDQEPQFQRDIAVWAVVALAAGVVLHIAARRALVHKPTRLSTLGLLMFAAAAMVALTITWTLHGLDGSTAAPAQLQFLRRMSTDSRVLAASLDPPSRLPPDTAIAEIQIAPGARYASTGGNARRDRPLLALPAVPAGTYRIRPRTHGPGGVLMIGIGQDQFALRTETLAFPPASIDITFPVDVRALIVRGDEDAQRAVREIVVEPIETMRPETRLTDGMARRAVRYATASVFFLDERSFPEPEGFWVGGARDSAVVVQPDRPSGTIRLQLRNAGVDNSVVVETGAWRSTLDLGPGEERVVDVPVDPARRAALVRFTSRSGFRPSEVEPGNRDQRFLGVWVRIESH